jgi:alpha-maltose-1-phosphate synthase
MRRRLRIAIASAGRFHVLDAARELHTLGHDVRFYSYVSRLRARQFGLPGECHVSLLPFAFPALAGERLLPKLAPRVRERVLYSGLNAAVMLRLQPCDVFHFMSGIYLEAAKFAKRRFGAKLVLDRASKHILAQDKLLADAGSTDRPSALTIRRELEGYACADVVCVPSSHVQESFLDYKIETRIVPFGVDLCAFPFRTRTQSRKAFTFLSVGNWSIRKGSDLLSAAVRRIPGTRLVHVGKILDVAFPCKDAQFVHFDAVPQPDLARYYADCDAFVLASREDGFGVVLLQALASGLPVVCSAHTGGADLASAPGLAARMTVVAADNVDALTVAMSDLRDRVECCGPLSPLSDADRELLSWRNYARRLIAAYGMDSRNGNGR